MNDWLFGAQFCYKAGTARELQTTGIAINIMEVVKNIKAQVLVDMCGMILMNLRGQ
jgi:hypothetical protein